MFGNLYRSIWDVIGIISEIEGAKNPHNYRMMTNILGKDGMPGKYKQEKIELSLFDMEKDPFETTNVFDQYPVIANKLLGFAETQKLLFIQRKNN
jgi:hypothetical protein